MMLRRLVLLALLLPLLGAHLLLTGQAAQARKALPVDLQTSAFVPAPLLRISALEYKGLLADLLFIKAHVFLGSTHERVSEPRVSAQEWQWLLGMLRSATALDPLFLDPYYLGNAQLTWEAGMVEEANALLARGSAARDWDWLLLFYQGFNHFYFLDDNVTAAELLMQGALRPEAPELLATLASRLAYQEARAVNALVFLEGLLAREEDERRRRDYQLRIDALRGIVVLEQAVAAFREEHSRLPANLGELSAAGILKRLPQDPYGGEFYLDEQGRVRTTSDLRMATK